MREKEFGIWNAFTWADYQTRVKRMALGMQARLARGETVALIGNNRPEWVWGEIAAHAAGAMSLGLYQGFARRGGRLPAQLRRREMVFAEDEEQVDKLLDLTPARPASPTSSTAIPRGMRKYSDPRLVSLKLYDLGEDRRRAIRISTTARSTTRGADVAILCTTSGTTANPNWRCCRRARPAPCARLSARSIRRGRTTNMSRCCRCPGSWSRSTRWAKGCSAG